MAQSRALAGASLRASLSCRRPNLDRELAIQVDGYSDGVGRRWADGRLQRLEGLVDNIADSIEVLLAVRRTNREAQQERSRRWEEMARRRKLPRAREERETARWRFFDEMVQLSQKARSFRSSLEGRLIEGEPGNSPNFARMINWAEAQLCEMERKLRVDAIERRLAAEKLFPELRQDELHDPLGDPPNSEW